MNNGKHGIAHRLLAAFLALVLVFGMIPATSIPVYAATTGQYATVSTYNGGDISGSGTETMSVTIQNTTLEWSPEAANHVAGWWAGVLITAPAGFSADAKYKVNGAEKSFAAYKDGENIIQLWMSISPDELSSGNTKTVNYAFDWNADTTFEQTLAFSIVPGEIILKKDNEQVYPGMNDVAVTTTPWKYDGKAHTLVSVVAQEGDTVTYKLGEGDVTETVPTATNAGIYSVTVYVARAGYKTLEKTVSVEVGKADIPAVLTANTGLVYSGEAQTLVTLSGAEAADEVTWTVNGEAVGSEGIPVGIDAKSYEVSVSVKRDDPNYNVFNKTVEVVIDKANIEDVTLEAVTDLAYTGEDHALVTLSGVVDSDVITWIVNEEATGSEDIPARMAVGTYNIVLTVNRGENYYPLTKAVTAEIGPGTISLGKLIVKGLNGVYTGEAQKAVTVENVGDGYTLRYQIANVVDGKPVANEEAWTAEIPTVTAAGSYVVLVKAVQTNYSDKNVDVTPADGAVTPYNVYIAPQKVEKPAADETAFVYNGSEQTYVIADSDLYTVEGNKQTNAGEYDVIVSLKDKKNYVWADGTTGNLSLPFHIDKASQSLSFNDPEYTDGGSQNVIIYGSHTFIFGATKNAYEGNEVVYSLGEGTDEDIAEISADGNVTVSDAGTVVVVASLAGNDNYSEVTITYTLKVTEGSNDASKLISFANSNVSYIFGEANGTVSTQTAAKRHQNDKNPTYSISNTDIGLTIDDTGKVTVADYQKLGDALTTNSGSVSVTVTAEKEAETSGGLVLYEADKASYTVTVSFMATPDSAYVLSGTKGTIYDVETGKNVETGWYVSAVTAAPADPEAYTVSSAFLPSGFDANSANTVKFSNQGSADRKIYLRSKATGGITAAISVNISIDTEIKKPDISYVANPLGKALEWLTFGFYSPDVTVEIQISENTSGIHHFDYSYAIQENVSEINKGGSGTKAGEDITYKDGVYRTSFKIPAQFRGYVTVKATDNAGNTSEFSDDKVVVVDSIAPGVNVSFDNNNVSNGNYYSAERTATITITEANFFPEDLTDGKLVITVGKTLNDGTFTTEDVKPEFTKKGDEYTHTIMFNENADYTLDIQYTDRSGNPAKPFHDSFTVDMIDPVIEIEVTNNDVRNGEYFNTERIAYITVTEHNFDSTKFKTGITVDGNNPDKEPVWTSEGDVHTTEIKFDGDHHYTMNPSFADLAGRVDQDGPDYGDSVVPEKFTVDETDPVDLSISYSEAVSVWHDLLEAITMGFYQTPIGVTIQATDPVAGINRFECSYDVEAGASKINQGGSRTITSKDISYGENGTATATFEIPAQFRGSVSFTAIDRADNDNSKSDKEVETVVADTTPPVIKVTYDNKDARVVKDEITGRNVYYYRADRTATITITEANFFAADMNDRIPGTEEEYLVITVRKTLNGGTYSETVVRPEFTSDGDVHKATYTFDEDADYTFDIKYTDRSGNVATPYTDSFTLDKTAPIVDITIGDVSVLDKDHSVTFDKFYPKETVIKLDANCGISGMESLQYQKVNAVSDYVVNGTWTDYDAEKGIVVSPNEKLVIFVRAEDRAGNVTIVNSTGIVVDDQMPIGEINAPEIDILPAAPDANGFHNGNVAVDLKVVDPRYAGGSANDAGFYSGLNEITYRIYTTDTDEVEEGVLLDLENVTEGAVYDSDNLVSSWSGKITIDSAKFNSNNVIVEISATDNAGNRRDSSTAAGDIQIDVTAPEIDISYDNNNPDSGSYYNTDRVATVTITERNFRAEDVKINITNTDGTIPTTPGSISDWTEVAGTGNKDNTTYTATIRYSADGDYKFDITCTDLASNPCAGANFAEGTQNPTEFTIDQTRPVVRVSYNNNEAENEMYFKATRTATVTITEHNFDVDRVKFALTADRGGEVPNITWANYGDTHTATVSYATDGDYTFDVTMTDKAGNQCAGTDYGNSVAGKDFVIDTTFEDMITVDGVENGKAYGYGVDVIPTVDISDINLEEYKITLVGVQKDKKIDLTEKVNELLKAETENVTGTFDIFEAIQDTDGIYTLSVTSRDKAGNEDAEEITFTVNRFGSVYVYDEYLMDLISNGGAYVQSVSGDIVITEYNADKLVSDSLVIEITCDGKPLENVNYKVTPEINDTVAVGESGWYQYKYTISKENFASDGVYKISVSTKDATGNTPENNRYEDLGITFWVDSTLAEISSIVGLEEAIINATEQVVKYTVYDTMGIMSIKVYVDGQLVDEITDFSTDPNNYEGSFVLTEQSRAQSVRLVVEDLSGNITDTDAEDFSSAYVFNKSVTVSTNIFVRWYANKPLFWGSIGGVAVVAGGLWFLLAAMRKKKEEKEAV